MASLPYDKKVVGSTPAAVIMSTKTHLPWSQTSNGIVVRAFACGAKRPGFSPSSSQMSDKRWQGKTENFLI